MTELIIRKADVPAFLVALAGLYRVVAPQRVGPADVVFDDFAAGREVLFDYVNAMLPPKALFFPRRESLFAIQGIRRPALVPAPPPRRIALFGLRSCDATAIAFMERFFGERGFDDGSVTGGIRQALKMTLACGTPGPQCFCVCCDGGPFLTAGFDIQFTDLGDHLLAEVATPRGAEAVGAGGTRFTEATAANLKAKRRQVAEVDQKFTRRSFVAEGVKRISLDRIPQDAWDEWAADCQGCGGCCFVCPTCSCFTVRDVEVGPDACRRERSWDACLYEGFTREASGHNPRHATSQRVKRRYFHKLSMQYMQVMGRHGCVGCGRCVDVCMGDLDVSTLLSRMHDERH